MFKKLAVSTITAALLASSPALAAGGLGKITDYDFSFEGPFGTYDRNQLQRGLQVYTEVCSSCHGLEKVAFRNLSDPNGPELPDDQMRAYAEMFEIWDPELRDWRTATAPDHFPESQFEGAPDLSLMAKSRVGFSGPYGLGINQLMNGMGGAEYIASFTNGFNGDEKFEAGSMFYYNEASSSWVSMAPVLYDDGVEYADGTTATADQQAQDVAAFLMWAAEPKMVERKQAGFVGVIFLSVLAALLYLTNKQLWAPIKRAAKED
ncbi:MAG: ubiquinol-cytochrome c reductase cytochrome c1 subunit PetC [Roseibaca calidilacus]|uniref:Cytochrome c1 n=1 Tax=Roseibaca calidilacus TaxID=1666912 RepID=A0A0N8K771_9RHOB|nr:cytochrome c1 [Roseibaca calidilacus]KPP90921.1 MAG: ubiquinol-cytochrome c reductase cytochrome c1 subunit PetC [Roseibaca calidilacus]CUX83804.1 ubiquinol-cytochrome c reductase cytochrome c1 subunit [Roseibaca calidilacus]